MPGIGERHHKAKLTVEQVRYIRNRHKVQSRTDGASAIARDLGVSSATIHRIIHGTNWRYVKDELSENNVRPAIRKEIKMTIPKGPSIMIATPMYGGMCTGAYMQGVLQTMSKLSELGVQIFWVQMTNESLITRARNELTRIFLEKGFDYLMFIDADISFDGMAVAELLAADKDIAVGIYPKKEVDWAAVGRAAKAGKENLEDYGGAFVMNMIDDGHAETDSSGLIEVRHGGTGFMLIKRGVFDALTPHVPTYRVTSYQDAEGNYAKPLTHEFFATSIDNSGALLSEDYHFCELWRKHGGKIYANPFIKLHHVGTYVYGGDILRAGGNLK